MENTGHVNPVFICMESLSVFKLEARQQSHRDQIKSLISIATVNNVSKQHMLIYIHGLKHS